MASAPNSNRDRDHKQSYGYGDNNLPLYAITGLSHILTAHEACKILGEPTVRSIVRFFLRFTAALVPPNAHTHLTHANANAVNGNNTNSTNSISYRRSVMNDGDAQSQTSKRTAATTATSTSSSTSTSPSLESQSPLGAEDVHKMLEVLDPEEIEDETYWMNIFTAALCYNFNEENSESGGDVDGDSHGGDDGDGGNKHNNKNAKSDHQKSTPKRVNPKKKKTSTFSSSKEGPSGDVPTWCRTTWHRLLNLPPSTTYQNLTPAQQQQQHLTTHLNPKIPFPLLGLDKSSFLQSGVLFPNAVAPHAGPKGHLALMECVFYAVASPPPTVLLNRLARVSNLPMKPGFKGLNHVNGGSSGSMSGGGASAGAVGHSSSTRSRSSSSDGSTSARSRRTTNRSSSQSSKSQSQDVSNELNQNPQDLTNQWKEYMSDCGQSGCILLANKNYRRLVARLLKNK